MGSSYFISFLFRRNERGVFLLAYGIGILDYLAVKKSYNSRGILLCKLGVVGDHNNKSLSRDLTDKLHYLHAGDRVKRARRLVGKKYLGLVYKRTCDSNSLALTARELIRTLVILVGETNLIKSRLCPSYPLLFINARNSKRKLYVAKHSLVRNKVIGLKNEAYTMVSVNVPISVTVELRALTVDNQVTRGVSVKTAHDVKQRGLSASRGAEDRNEFSVTEGYIHTAKRVYRLRGGYVILRNIA